MWYLFGLYVFITFMTAAAVVKYEYKGDTSRIDVDDVLIFSFWPIVIFLFFVWLVVAGLFRVATGILDKSEQLWESVKIALDKK